MHNTSNLSKFIGEQKLKIRSYFWTVDGVWSFSLRSNNTFFTLGCDRVPSCQQSLFRCQQEVKRMNIQHRHRLKHFWKEVSMNGLKFFWTSVVMLLVGMCFYFWPITYFWKTVAFRKTLCPLICSLFTNFIKNSSYCILYTFHPKLCSSFGTIWSIWGRVS